MKWGGVRTPAVTPVSRLTYLLGMALFIVLAYGDYFDVNIDPIGGVIMMALYCVYIWDHVKFKYPVFYLLGIAFFGTFLCGLYLNFDTRPILLAIVIALVCFNLWYGLTSK